MKDSKNIVIGLLCTVLCIMAVAYAAFSTQLTVNGTASIQSNWSIEFEAGNNGNCTAVSLDAGAPSSGTVTVNGTTATVTALMSSPGDSLECTIIAKNTGSLPAIRKSWLMTNRNGSDWNDSGALLDGFSASANATTNEVLAPGTGTETLTVNINYSPEVGEETGYPTKPEQVTFTLTAIYEQALS